MNDPARLGLEATGVDRTSVVPERRSELRWHRGPPLRRNDVRSRHRGAVMVGGTASHPGRVMSGVDGGLAAWYLQHWVPSELLYRPLTCYYRYSPAGR